MATHHLRCNEILKLRMTRPYGGSERGGGEGADALMKGLTIANP